MSRAQLLVDQSPINKRTVRLRSVPLPGERASQAPAVARRRAAQSAQESSIPWAGC